MEGQINLSDTYEQNISRALTTSSAEEFISVVRYLAQQANKREIAIYRDPTISISELGGLSSDLRDLRAAVAHGAFWFGGSNMYKLEQKAKELGETQEMSNHLSYLRSDLFGSSPVQFGRILPEVIMDLIAEG